MQHDRPSDARRPERLGSPFVPRPRTLSGLVGLSLLLPLLSLACDRSGGEEPEGTEALPSDVLLRIGDVDLDRSEFETLEAYYRDVQPELGERTLRRNLLDQHFLPMIADRLVAGEAREAARTSAENLRRVAGTANQLTRRLELEQIQPLWVGWTDLPFAARQFACDPSSIGGVGPVFAAPGAFHVIGVLDVQRNSLRKTDRAQIILRTFPIRPSENAPGPDHSARKSLKQLPLTAAPDIRDALPTWLTDR